MPEARSAWDAARLRPDPVPRAVPGSGQGDLPAHERRYALVAGGDLRPGRRASDHELLAGVASTPGELEISRMGGMVFQDFSAAAAFVREHEIRMIDLKFTDLWGRWHHVTLSATEFSPRLMEAGVGFDGSSVGLRSVKSGDMALIPDLTTGASIPSGRCRPSASSASPWRPTASGLYFRDPRNIARRAEEYMRGTGLADESRWGPEFEFYVFDKRLLRERRQCRQLPRGLGRSRLAQRRGRPRPLRPAPRRLPRHPAQGSAPQRCAPRSSRRWKGWACR